MSVLKVKDNGVWKDVPSIKGDTGDAAGFGTATASVDTGTGTPSCVVTLSGEDTAKNFDFAFHNLMYDDSDLQSDFADLADDFDVLQGQFDTAVAALTVDSEVADIRVGDDGVTYASAGAAVRGQFHDVKSDLNELVEESATLYAASTLVSFNDPQGTDFVVETLDGSNFDNGHLYMYNSSKTQIMSKTLATVYGSKHTFSNSTGDVYFVALENASANGIRVYIPDQTRIVPRFEELEKTTAEIIEGEYDSNTVKAIWGKNRFNKNTVIDGYFNSDGSIESSSTICISDFIPVSYGVEYQNVDLFSGGGKACYYDKDYKFISSVSADSLSFNPPSNAKYIRVQVLKANLDTHMFGIRGTITSGNYIPYSEYPAVRYDIELNLTEEEKARARNNIGAQSANTSEDALYGKTLMVFGDSISYGSNSDGVSYADIVAEMHDMTIDKYTTPGATWCYKSGRSCLKTMVNNVVGDASVSAPDFVILSGGYNDAQNSVLNPLGSIKLSETSDNDEAFNGIYDEDTFCGALERSIYRVHKKWVNARILYVITYDIPSQKEWSQTYAPKIREICKKWSVPICDLMQEGGLICCQWLTEHSTIFTDNVHPNLAGQTRFARLVNEKLKQIV